MSESVNALENRGVSLEKLWGHRKWLWFIFFRNADFFRHPSLTWLSRTVNYRRL